MRRRGTILDATLYVYGEMAAEHAAHPTGPAPYCRPALAQRLTNQAYRDGVAISTGTDAFSGLADPWPSLLDELELLQDKAGMKPPDVLHSATVVGAMTMHLQGDMGTLETGKLANMVFTRQDPTVDVRGLRTVVLTVKRGAPYWRKDYRVPTGIAGPGE